MRPQPQVNYWYAIRTRSRAERVVRDQLAGRRIESLLPLAKRISRWKDRKKLIEWPLFPGYCFAKFCNDQNLIVLQTPGVVEIVGSGNSPESIPEEEIVAIQHVMNHALAFDSHPYLEQGMTVLVTRGFLQGVEGKLIRKADRCRLVVSINLIRQSVAVHIDADDVIPVDKAGIAVHPLITSKASHF